MKLIVVLLISVSILEAKTWIELAKDAEYYPNHPGREIKIPKDDPVRLQYLESSVETLQKIITGKPAILPADIPFVEPDWPGALFFAQKNLYELIEIRSETQDWNGVIDLLSLAKTINDISIASEPNLNHFLKVYRSPRTCTRILKNLSEIKNPIDRRKTFLKLKEKWSESKLSRADFLLTQKGQTRLWQHIASDYPKFIHFFGVDPDATPKTWGQEIPYPLTNSELLQFTNDPAKSVTEVKEQLDVIYQWVGSKKTFKEYEKSRGKRVVRAREFYQQHPNGLGEFMADVFPFKEVAKFAAMHEALSQLQEVVWAWHTIEAAGVKFDNKEGLIRALPSNIQTLLKESQIVIDIKNRVIRAPRDSVLDIRPTNELRVHQIFTN